MRPPKRHVTKQTRDDKTTTTTTTNAITHDAPKRDRHDCHTKPHDNDNTPNTRPPKRHVTKQTRRDETTTTTTNAITHDASKRDRHPKRHHDDPNAQPQRVKRRGSAPGHTKDGQGGPGGTDSGTYQVRPLFFLILLITI
jgi:hypothetical protein